MPSPNYSSRDAFYEARGGQRSGECDYGMYWHGPGRGWPRSGLHIVHETGDVYLNNLHDRTIEVLATLPTNGSPECPLGPRHDNCPYAIGDRMLRGWAEEMYEDTGIGWLRWALQGYPVREESDARPI